MCPKSPVSAFSRERSPAGMVSGDQCVQVIAVWSITAKACYLIFWPAIKRRLVDVDPMVTLRYE